MPRGSQWLLPITQVARERVCNVFEVFLLSLSPLPTHEGCMEMCCLAQQQLGCNQQEIFMKWKAIILSLVESKAGNNLDP